MRFNQRFVKGVTVLGITGVAYFGQQIAVEKIFTQNVAQARAIASYNPDVNPFTADASLKSLAKKAKSGSELETAKKIHALLKIQSPGGLKPSSSGGEKDERPPRTAAETLKKGGDCSEFGYVVLTLANDLGMKSGIIFLDVGGGVLHLLPYVEADNKKYIIDPQLDEFGLGGARLKTGKIVKLTYEDARKGKTVRFVREMDFSQASAAYHMEWGNYLEDNKDVKNALSAFKEALKRDPGFGFIQRKVGTVSAKIFNQIMKDAHKAYNSQNWQRAAGLFEDAIAHFPESLDNAKKGSVHSNAGACRYNAGHFKNAAEHYDKAFELTGNEKYKKEADEAREKAK